MDYREHFAGLSCDMLISKAIYYAELTDVYERENKKLASKVKGAEEVIEGLEKELTKTREEKDSRINNLCDQIASKNGLIGTLRSQLNNTNNTIEALKSRNNDNNEVATDLELNNRKLLVRIQELEKQLKQAAELGDICMDKIRDLEMKNGKLNEEVKNYAELIKENDSLRNRNDHLAKVNNQLDYRVREMIELKDNLYERIREFEKRNNELAIELDEYKHAYEHSREECYKLTTFVNTETSVTPKNLWKAGETAAESFAADVKAKEPEEPVCKTVPCSTVIGKLENYWVNSEGVRIQIRLSEKASAYFKATKPHIIGEEIDIKDLQMKMPDSLQKNMDEFVAKRNKIFDEGCGNYLMKYCTTNIEAKAKHIKNKYDALRKVGFTDDQAMSMLPMWDDEDYV